MPLTEAERTAWLKQSQEEDAKRVYIDIQMRIGSWTLTSALADQASILMSDEGALVVSWGDDELSTRIFPMNSWRSADIRRVRTDQLVESLVNPRYL